MYFQTFILFLFIIKMRFLNVLLILCLTFVAPMNYIWTVRHRLFIFFFSFLNSGRRVVDVSAARAWDANN